MHPNPYPKPRKRTFADDHPLLFIAMVMGAVVVLMNAGLFLFWGLVLATLALPIVIFVVAFWIVRK